MKARATSYYVCQNCGVSQTRWSGRCGACQSWNTLVEEQTSSGATKALKRASGKELEFSSLTGSEEGFPRRISGISEFDRVCGGGLVPGSALLVGGDPGIGKSTLLLQAVAHLSKNYRCVYISGEEALDQVRMRASRLNIAAAPVQLASATNVGEIIAALDSAAPEIAIIDSIQTMYLDALDSAPGTVSQVRACAHELIHVAKKRNIALFMVGHVTKEGVIAGPRVLEHMVDTVLYFEGERGHQFRILRAVKNRYGPTDEIGVFEMSDQGLKEVSNPSALFLAERQDDVTGSAVFAGIEGTRPVLVEVQALIAPSSLATPRRAVVGWDQARLAMIIAVLEARCGLNIAGKDVYLNIAGGLRVNEPAADLAVAASLLSAFTHIPVPKETIIFGEIGLSGEIRTVSQTDIRLKEAAKLGFTNAYLPSQTRGVQAPSGLSLNTLRSVRDLFPVFELTPRSFKREAR